MSLPLHCRSQAGGAPLCAGERTLPNGHPVRLAVHDLDRDEFADVQLAGDPHEEQHSLPTRLPSAAL